MTRTITHKLALCAAAMATVLIFGCADTSDKISASYVSPLKYNSYTCSQLEQEYANVVEEAQLVSKAQDDIASSDSVASAGTAMRFARPSGAT